MNRGARLMASVTLAGACALATTATASAQEGSGARRVEMRDDCDPVTFTAALGPGVCTGDGETTFDELVASLVAGEPDDHWRMHPRKVEVRRGQDLALVNRGGEFHSFSEVPRFGAGCVPELNDLLGLTGPPVADCGAALSDPATALPAGGRGVVHTGTMALGTHKFECLVHPWMTAEVTVRRR